MAKGDKWNQVLMFNCNVKLKCDDEVLELKYTPVEGNGWGTWWKNGEDTGLQVLALIKELKEKYKLITVLYKRRY